MEQGPGVGGSRGVRDLQEVRGYAHGQGLQGCSRGQQLWRGSGSVLASYSVLVSFGAWK